MTVQQTLKVEDIRKNIDAVLLEEKIETSSTDFGVGEQAPAAGQISQEDVVEYNESLLDRDDQDFVENAYREILGREGDRQGMANYLGKLRNGIVCKEEIICAMRFSREGRAHRAKIKNLPGAILKTLLCRLPLIESLVRKYDFVKNGPREIRNLTNENRLIKNKLTTMQERQRNDYAQLGESISQLGQETAILSEQIAGLNEKYVCTEKQTAILAEQTAVLTEQKLLLNKKIEDVRAFADNICIQLNLLKKTAFSRKIDFQKNSHPHEKQMQEPEAIKVENLDTEAEESQNDRDGDLINALYVAFEDAFRGSEELVGRRLSCYLPWITENLQVSAADARCLDVGCGRGEWLQLLREAHYTARGIDLNPVAIRQCRERGLAAETADGLAELQRIPDSSLDLVTAFHLIEHLHYTTLMRFLLELTRTVKVGGLIILETPNPTNILVSSYDFYRDPSHRNPVHPDTLCFLLQSLGCRRVQSLGLSHVQGTAAEECQRVKFVELADYRHDSLEDYVHAPRDYCILAIR